jgi:phosphoserine phosphatase
MAIDHSEFTHLAPAQIAQVVRIIQDAGMTATVSSIHVNGWFGKHNKLSGARWIVHQLFDRDLDAERHRWALVGDSTNDQVMFEHFSHSVGWPMCAALKRNCRTCRASSAPARAVPALPRWRRLFWPRGSNSKPP